jgi:hypothetical protein
MEFNDRARPVSNYLVLKREVVRPFYVLESLRVTAKKGTQQATLQPAGSFDLEERLKDACSAVAYYGAVKLARFRCGRPD